MGDFNTPGFLGPNTHRFLPPVLRLMRRAGYEDAFHAVGYGHGKTFPSHTPLVRIDFLLARPATRRWDFALPAL